MVGKNFLLQSDLAVKLYESVNNLPIIDWHNHLSVNDLLSNRTYNDAAELWLLSDPYKHRAMRICGVPEKFITGDASNYEKFIAWSNTLPQLPGNPLYHWSKMELSRVFGIEKDLNADSADEIWHSINEKLQQTGFSAQNLLKKFNVKYAAPCVLFNEDVSCFKNINGVVPSLRCDDLHNFSNALFSQAADLSELAALFETGLMKLHRAGCRFSDHALDSGFVYYADDGRNEERFAMLKNNTASQADKEKLSCHILRMLGSMYAELNWTMQLHIGALRNTSDRLRAVAGPAGGYAAIGHSADAVSIAAMLKDLENSPSGLCRVMLYTLNPADHAMLAVLSGSFPGDGERGKVQLGPAWWYCDHIYSITDCLENIAAFGVLSVFPGMTTDSRSILSFVRHEYFRRILCNFLAEKAKRDEMPENFEILENIAVSICCKNAKNII